MWYLQIKCIAAVASCIINADPLPPVKRDFDSKIQCERAMDALNMYWRPAQGAWKMNCVKR